MIFLRPWFLLLIFVAVLFWVLRKQIGNQSVWAKYIDKRLLPYLLVGQTVKNHQNKRPFYEVILWVLLSIALAGPAWHKVSVPTESDMPATVVIAELSPKMDASTVRLLQQKIYDVLNLAVGQQVGLVLYDRLGYEASPITPDTDIVRDMVPMLSPDVLPEKGSNPAAGFEKAHELFQRVHAKQGRILFITAGNFEAEVVSAIVGKYPYEIGSIALTKKNLGALGKLGVVVETAPNGQDVKTVWNRTSVEGNEKTADTMVEQWQDMGFWVALMTFPFFVLLFKRGIYFAWVLVLLPSQAMADIWQRPDQVSYARQIQGVNAYRAGDYEQAERIFSEGQSIIDLYNLGNTLAQQMKLDEAIQAYDTVLSQHPGHEQALFNKKLLEKLKKDQDEQRQNNQDNSNQSSEKNQSDSGDANQEKQSDINNLENQNGVSEKTDSPQQDDKTTESEKNVKHQAESVPLEKTNEQNLQSQSVAGQEQSEFDQETQEVLNRLPYDAGQILRYRLERQYIKQQGGI